MIIVKVLCSFPCSDEAIQSDLARRLTVSFKMCCEDQLFDSSDLHVSFLASQADYQGTKFLKSKAVAASTTTTMTTTTTTTTTPTKMTSGEVEGGRVAMVHVEVIGPPTAEYGTSVFKTRLLARLAKELDDWISSSFRFAIPAPTASSSSSSSPPRDHPDLIPFSDVVPLIEYRQLLYGSHALDGQVVVSPYGIM